MLSSWQCHCESSSGLRDECRTEVAKALVLRNLRQAASCHNAN